MARAKMQRFAENELLTNVVQPEKEIYNTIKGNWRKDFFKNENPIVLELACGYGEYTLGLAEQYPDKNFIGIDIKGDRIWKGAKYASENGLDNVGFLRCLIHSLENFFEDGEVDEIWIIHPDPRPRDKDEKRRLTHKRFLDLYKKLLKEDGWMRLKTDNPGLFEYSLEVLEKEDISDLEYTKDLYNSPLYAEHHNIVTRYEKKFREQGFSINYLKFKFNR